jgi:flavin reductase (DIM6/NTAB) family NADH-FMN oxidoreductase RutF
MPEEKTMPKEQIPLDKAHRLITSGPVTLITAAYKDRIGIMPASWVIPISLKPLMVAIAVNPAAFTHDLIDKSNEFAINVPTGDIARAVKQAGSISSRDVDKFKLIGLHPISSQKITAPLVEECIGHLECGVIERFTPGDHTIFIATVLAAQVEAGTFEGVWLVEKDEVKLLHHLGGSTYCVPKGRFDV